MPRRPTLRRRPTRVPTPRPTPPSLDVNVYSEMFPMPQLADYRGRYENEHQAHREYQRAWITWWDEYKYWKQTHDPAT
jgi:hypothetical protein